MEQQESFAKYRAGSGEVEGTGAFLADGTAQADTRAQTAWVCASCAMRRGFCSPTSGRKDRTLGTSMQCMQGVFPIVLRNTHICHRQVLSSGYHLSRRSVRNYRLKVPLREATMEGMLGLQNPLWDSAAPCSPGCLAQTSRNPS